MLAAATALLRRTFGHDDFRPLQRRVIEPVLAGRDVLAVLPTGGGKSLCFQVPALHGRGVTVVVSPLIALMQDQVSRLKGRGVGAATLSGDVDQATQEATFAAAAARTAERRSASIADRCPKGRPRGFARAAVARTALPATA